MNRQTKKDSSQALVQSAKEYIEAHSAEKFSLEEIAGALFVNGSHLLRAFKRQTGRTLLAYHNHVRCEKVKAYLLSTDMSVSKIGEIAGFISPSHLAYVFRKLNGCSPSEYRASRGRAGSAEGNSSDKSLFTVPAGIEIDQTRKEDF